MRLVIKNGWEFLGVGDCFVIRRLKGGVTNGKRNRSQRVSDENLKVWEEICSLLNK